MIFASLFNFDQFMLSHQDGTVKHIFCGEIQKIQGHSLCQSRPWMLFA